MTPSPAPSPVGLQSIVSQINWGNLVNGVSTIFSGGNVGIIAAGVFVVILIGVCIYFHSAIIAALVKAAAAGTTTTNTDVHNNQPVVSGDQEGQISTDQQALSGQEQADLLKFLQGLTDSALYNAAVQAHTAAAVQSAAGSLDANNALTADQRQAIYKLYGAV